MSKKQHFNQYNAVEVWPHSDCWIWSDPCDPKRNKHVKIMDEMMDKAVELLFIVCTSPKIQKSVVLYSYF